MLIELAFNMYAIIITMECISIFFLDTISIFGIKRFI